MSQWVRGGNHVLSREIDRAFLWEVVKSVSLLRSLSCFVGVEAEGESLNHRDNLDPFRLVPDVRIISRRVHMLAIILFEARLRKASGNN